MLITNRSLVGSPPLDLSLRVYRADQIAALEQQVAEAAEEQSALVEKSRAYVVRLRDQLNEEHTTTVRQVPCPSPVSDGCLSCQTPKRRFCPDGVLTLVASTDDEPRVSLDERGH